MMFQWAALPWWIIRGAIGCWGQMKIWLFQRAFSGGCWSKWKTNVSSSHSAIFPVKIKGTAGLAAPRETWNGSCLCLLLLGDLQKAESVCSGVQHQKHLQYKFLRLPCICVLAWWFTEDTKTDPQTMICLCVSHGMILGLACFLFMKQSNYWQGYMYTFGKSTSLLFSSVCAPYSMFWYCVRVAMLM